MHLTDPPTSEFMLSRGAAQIAPESWPRTLLYPLVGAGFALGAPAGLFVIRTILHLVPEASFGLSLDTITFAYDAVSTVIAFIVFGIVLGRTVDRLRSTSITDPLTGLYNRRYFHHRFTTELRRATRYNVPLSLLLIDVDELKHINDAHGHEAGDAAIRAVASAIAKTCRITDVAARFGGDEFVVLAPGVRADAALELAARLRGMLREGPVERGRVIPSVSIGVTDVYLCGQPSAERMYQAADEALYVAKDRGRDQAALSADARS